MVSMIDYLIADVYTNSLTPRFESNREATLGERGDGDKSVGCFVDYGDGTKDGAKVRVMGAYELRVVGEGDGERARPWADG